MNDYNDTIVFVSQQQALAAHLKNKKNKVVFFVFSKLPFFNCDSVLTFCSTGSF